MSHSEQKRDSNHADTAPGDERLDGHEAAGGIGTYLIGLGLATLLTIVSFFVARTTLVWQPSIPVALAVLAIAQMGVHLVFFLHITTGPDNVNNVMALAFGVHGACLRRADCFVGHHRFALDHGTHEPQHDAYGSDHADAALSWAETPRNGGWDTFRSIACVSALPHGSPALAAQPRYSGHAAGRNRLGPAGLRSEPLQNATWVRIAIAWITAPGNVEPPTAVAVGILFTSA